MEKMRALVGVYYRLHSNGLDYLKTLWTNWIFLDTNPDEVYDKISSILQLNLLILFSRKLANLSRP